MTPAILDGSFPAPHKAAGTGQVEEPCPIVYRTHTQRNTTTPHNVSSLPPGLYVNVNLNSFRLSISRALDEYKDFPCGTE